MTAIITTERLQLIEAELRFADDLAVLFNDASVQPEVGFEKFTPETAGELLTHWRSAILMQPRTFFGLLVTPIGKPDELVGMATLRLPPDEPHFDAGMVISPTHRRQGYAAEALRGVVSYVFTTLNHEQVKAGANPNNRASHHMLLRAGFQPSHIEPNSWWNGIKFEDNQIYFAYR